jgi:endonuclease YncB( thermonuclease family)
LLLFKVLWRKILAVSLLSVVVFVAVTGCAQTEATPLPGGAVSREATIMLPTAVPTLPSTPLNTRVMPVEVLTPQPTTTITPIPDEGRAMVVGIVDGNTVLVVMEGDSPDQVYVVKYLGIEAPPPTDPWGAVARETNRKLTSFKVVRLVRDETNFDDDGYLPRYVYLDDQLLSVLLAERGLARAAISPPDIRFEDDILAAEAQAKASKLGLWSGSPPTPTFTPVLATEEGPVEIEGTPLATLTVSSGTITITITPAMTLTETVAATATISPTGTISTEGSE